MLENLNSEMEMINGKKLVKSEDKSHNKQKKREREKKKNSGISGGKTNIYILSSRRK